MLSIPHMIIVFIVVLVVFGPQKLPELARSLGKLMAEFRKASTDFRSAFEEEMRDMERQALQVERKKAAEAAAASVAAEPTPPTVLTTSAGADSPSDGASPDSHAMEAPVISPVSEAVARAIEQPAETTSETDSETASATSTHDTPHDTQHPA
jgi:sec-independent protein translocase protein TatB